MESPLSDPSRSAAIPSQMPPLSELGGPPEPSRGCRSSESSPRPEPSGPEPRALLADLGRLSPEPTASSELSLTCDPSPQPEPILRAEPGVLLADLGRLSPEPCVPSELSPTRDPSLQPEPIPRAEPGVPLADSGRTSELVTPLMSPAGLDHPSGVSPNLNRNASSFNSGDTEVISLTPASDIDSPTSRYSDRAAPASPKPASPRQSEPVPSRTASSPPRHASDRLPLFGPHLRSRLSPNRLLRLRNDCRMPRDVELISPSPLEDPEVVRDGLCCAYEVFFRECRLSFPLPELLIHFMHSLGIALAQICPNLIRTIVGLQVLAEENGFELDVKSLVRLESVRGVRNQPGFFYSMSNPRCSILSGFPKKDEDWRQFYFYFPVNESTFGRLSPLAILDLSPEPG